MEGGECGGIQIPGYDGPDFLSKELGRTSPYEKGGYKRAWIADGIPERFRDCQPTPTAVLDYCYSSAPLTSSSGSRAFGGSGSGAISIDPTGAPLPCPIPQWCIREGVRVQTPSGATPVERLRVGDEVWARGADGSPSVNDVVATRHRTVDGHLRLTFDDGSHLEVTEVHPISTTEGWRAAGTLRPGDIVDGREGTLTFERVDRVPGQVVVYDLTVAPDACFYANGILVHNKIIE